MKLILFCLLSAGLAFSQEPPQDVFLESTTPTTPVPQAVEDLPPNEPPYTKTPDEVEAQQLLQAEPAQPPAEEKVTTVEPEPTKPGRKKIAHPDAKRGLYLIDQNTGRYYYKTEKISKKNQSTSIRVGMITAPNITTEASSGEVYSFADIYGEDDLTYLILDYEWQPFKTFGKLGVVMGVGFFTASGNGRFSNPAVKDGAPAKEGFTFIGLPISAGGIYRFEFSDKQWLAPFVAAGLSYYALGEIRDDGKPPKIVGTPAGYAGGGILFNITAWSRDIDFVMDREYGINNMWFAAEFRTVQSLSEDLDVSSDVFNFGISVDY